MLFSVPALSKAVCQACPPRGKNLADPVYNDLLFHGASLGLSEFDGPPSITETLQSTKQSCTSMHVHAAIDRQAGGAKPYSYHQSRG